jgi:cytochrome c oxidase subunit 2
MLHTLLPTPASEQGVWIQWLINITLAVDWLCVCNYTGTYYFGLYISTITEPERKAYFSAGSNKLEVIWTVVPAIALTFLNRIWYSKMVQDIFSNAKRCNTY